VKRWEHSASILGPLSDDHRPLIVQAPKTCYNFLMLAKAGKYNDVLFHRLVPGFMVSTSKTPRINWRADPWQIQTGDPTGTGAGGESHWGTPFRDEHDLKGAVKHDKRGVISMANKGANTNGLASRLFVILCLSAFVTNVRTHPYHYMTVFPIGGERCYVLFVSVVDSFRSQWFITFKPTPHLDKKHTVFGSIVGGDEVLDALEKLPVKPGTERPAKPVRITEVVVFVKSFCFPPPPDRD